MSQPKHENDEFYFDSVSYNRLDSVQSKVQFVYETMKFMIDNSSNWSFNQELESNIKSFIEALANIFNDNSDFFMPILFPFLFQISNYITVIPCAQFCLFCYDTLVHAILKTEQFYHSSIQTPEEIDLIQKSIFNSIYDSKNNILQRHAVEIFSAIFRNNGFCEEFLKTDRLMFFVSNFFATDHFQIFEQLSPIISCANIINLISTKIDCSNQILSITQIVITSYLPNEFKKMIYTFCFNFIHAAWVFDNSFLLQIEVQSFFPKFHEQNIIPEYLFELYYKSFLFESATINPLIISCICQIYQFKETNLDLKKHILQKMLTISSIFSTEFCADLDCFRVIDWFIPQINSDFDILDSILSMINFIMAKSVPIGVKSIHQLIPYFTPDSQYHNEDSPDLINIFMSFIHNEIQKFEISPELFNDDHFLNVFLNRKDSQLIANFILKHGDFVKLLRLLFGQKRMKYHSKELIDSIVQILNYDNSDQQLFVIFVDIFSSNLTPSILDFFILHLNEPLPSDLFFNFVSTSINISINLRKSNCFKAIMTNLTNLQNEEFMTYILRILNFVSMIVSQFNDHIFDDWLIEQPSEFILFIYDKLNNGNTGVANDNILSIKQKILSLILPNNQNLPFLIPSFIPIIASTQSISSHINPYNSYLLGKYSLPIYIKLETKLEMIPCLAQMCSQFISATSIQYFLQNPGLFASELRKVNTVTTPIFEFFTEEETKNYIPGWIEPQDPNLNLLSLTFQIKFDNLPSSSETFDFCTFNGHKLVIQKQNQVYLDDEFPSSYNFGEFLGTVSLGQWHTISLQTSRIPPKIDILFDGENNSSLKSESFIHLEFIGSKLISNVSYYVSYINSSRVVEKIEVLDFVAKHSVAYVPAQSLITIIDIPWLFYQFEENPSEDMFKVITAISRLLLPEQIGLYFSCLTQTFRIFGEIKPLWVKKLLQILQQIPDKTQRTRELIKTWIDFDLWSRSNQLPEFSALVISQIQVFEMNLIKERCVIRYLVYFLINNQNDLLAKHICLLLEYMAKTGCNIKDEALEILISLDNLKTETQEAFIFEVLSLERELDIVLFSPKFYLVLALQLPYSTAYTLFNQLIMNLDEKFVQSVSVQLLYRVAQRFASEESLWLSLGQKIISDNFQLNSETQNLHLNKSSKKLKMPALIPILLEMLIVFGKSQSTISLELKSRIFHSLTFWLKEHLPEILKPSSQFAFVDLIRGGHRVVQKLTIERICTDKPIPHEYCTYVSFFIINLLFSIPSGLTRSKNYKEAISLIESQGDPLVVQETIRLLISQYPDKLNEIFELSKACLFKGDSEFSHCFFDFCMSNKKRRDFFQSYLLYHSSNFSPEDNELLPKDIPKPQGVDAQKFELRNDHDPYPSDDIKALNKDYSEIREIISSIRKESNNRYFLTLNLYLRVRESEFAQTYIHRFRHNFIPLKKKIKASSSQESCIQSSNSDFSEFHAAVEKQKETKINIQTINSVNSYYINPFSLPNVCPSIIAPSPFIITPPKGNKIEKNPKNCFTLFGMHGDERYNIPIPHYYPSLFYFCPVFQNSIDYYSIMSFYLRMKNYTLNSYMNVTFIRFNYIIPSVVFTVHDQIFILLFSQIQAKAESKGDIMNELNLIDIDADNQDSILESILQLDFGNFSIFCGHFMLIIPISSISTITSYIWAGFKDSLILYSLESGPFILSFSSDENLNIFLNSHDIISSKYNEKIKESPSYLAKKWEDFKLSNFNYILKLNGYAGRTFYDLCSYPLMPRLINSFSDGFPIPEKDIRDLSQTLEACGDKDPNHATLIKRYQIQHFHHQESPSNAMMVSSFLVHFQPFSRCQWLMNEGWDAGDRNITSFPFHLSIHHKSIYEFVPELYYFPEIFLNLNHYSIPIKGEEQPFDVELPEWSHSMEEFIRQHRETLERIDVRKNLSHWIDLFFGKKQSGPDGEAALNLFNPLSYPCSPGVDPNQQHQWILTCGQVPQQVFTEIQSEPSIHTPQNLEIISDPNSCTDAEINLNSITVDVNPIIDQQILNKDIFIPQCSKHISFSGSEAAHISRGLKKLLIAITDQARRVQVYSRNDAQPHSTSKIKISNLVLLNMINLPGVRFSEINERQMICASVCDIGVVLWNVANGRILKIIEDFPKVIVFDKETDNMFMAKDTVINVYTASGMKIQEIDVKSDKVNQNDIEISALSIAWNENQKLLAIGYTNGFVEVKNLSKCTKSFFKKVSNLSIRKIVMHRNNLSLSVFDVSYFY